jgi:hypothetical protein
MNREIWRRIFLVAWSVVEGAASSMTTTDSTKSTAPLPRYPLPVTVLAWKTSCAPTIAILLVHISRQEERRGCPNAQGFKSWATLHGAHPYRSDRHERPPKGHAGAIIICRISAEYSCSRCCATEGDTGMGEHSGPVCLSFVALRSTPLTTSTGYPMGMHPGSDTARCDR